MPAGRPTKYDPSFCERVIEMGKEGASKAEMALDLGIARSSFDLYEKEHPEFSEAVKDAVGHSQAWWERMGREATFNSAGFSATSYIFQMKNRFPADWRDKRDHEHTGADGGPITYSDLTDRELDERLAKLMRDVDK